MTRASPSTARHSPLIIVAEDDLDDQLLLKEALKENGIAARDVVFVGDGEELISRLERLAGRPAIILLDLNMPKKDGREVLREIKNDESFKHIPVLILTTSSSEDDIKLSYRNGSNTFFIKPPIFDELVEIIRVIKLYWVERAALAV